MTTSSLLSTTSRIFGLYFFVLAALEVRNVIYSVVFEITSPSYREDAWLPVLIPVFSLAFDIVAGLILIYKAAQIAEKVGATATDNISISVTKTDIVELAGISIGFIAILYAVPVMLQKLVSYAYFNDYERHERHLFWNSNDTAAMIYFAFQFVAGLFLLLNARNFARRLQRVSEGEDARK